MNKSCRRCAQPFKITPKDLTFYEKVKVPVPALCADCRQQIRLLWRNERVLYNRTCDLTGEKMISFYAADSPYKVYAPKVWWSDRWDPLQYGRKYDFNRPFFEQFNDLLRETPHMGIMISDKNENSDYCPYSVGFKNSYMCVSGVYSESLYYCFWTHDSAYCMDCYACHRCELCYECIASTNLYNCIFCKDCENSSDMIFCEDCRNCKNCIGCFGLRNKEYYLFNQKASKEEFEKTKKELLSSGAKLKKIKAKFKRHILQFPHSAVHMTNTENCTGDYLKNCRNAHNCYHSENLEDCAYLWNIPTTGAKDCADTNYSPGSELVYNGMSAVNAYNSMNIAYGWDVKDTAYSFQTFYSESCFGCVGLKHKKYCILNKQYSEKEYKELMPKTIEHMRKTGEWGSYFPASLSPFAYNETIAQEFFPLTEKEAVTKKYVWKQPDKKEYQQQTYDIPDSIDDVQDSINNEILACSSCKKNYKIISRELKFYKNFHLPIPTKCPDCRHNERVKRLNPHKLWDRKCDKCGTAIKTTYATDRPEKVYCEKCYLKEVY